MLELTFLSYFFLPHRKICLLFVVEASVYQGPPINSLDKAGGTANVTCKIEIKS